MIASISPPPRSLRPARAACWCACRRGRARRSRRPMRAAADGELHQADDGEHDEDEDGRVGDGDAVLVVLDAADDVARRHVVAAADEEDDGADRGHGADEGIDERGEDRGLQQRQDDAAQGREGAGAEGERALVEAAVDLRHRGDAGAHADRHVAEDEGDDEDDAGAGQLDRRHVEGDDVGDADHRAGDGEGEHGPELEGALAGEVLADEEPGGQEADGGGQRGGDQRDPDRRPEGGPGRAAPVQAVVGPVDAEGLGGSGRGSGCGRRPRA